MLDLRDSPTNDSSEQVYLFSLRCNSLFCFIFPVAVYLGQQSLLAVGWAGALPAGMRESCGSCQMGPLIHATRVKLHTSQTSVFCLKLMSTHVNDGSQRRKAGRKEGGWRNAQREREGGYSRFLLFASYCCSAFSPGGLMLKEKNKNHKQTHTS